MRHATVQALRSVYDWLPFHNRFIDKPLRLRRACDWEEMHEVAFSALDAFHLLDGQPVDLPTCPSCATLLDVALELRGSTPRGQIHTP